MFLVKSEDILSLGIRSHSGQRIFSIFSSPSPFCLGFENIMICPWFLFLLLNTSALNLLPKIWLCPFFVKPSFKTGDVYCPGSPICPILRRVQQQWARRQRAGKLCNLSGFYRIHPSPAFQPDKLPDTLLLHYQAPPRPLPPITSDPLLLSDPNSPSGERQSCGGDGTNPGIHGYSRYFLIRGSPILPGGVLEIQFQRSAKDENETLLSRKCWGYVNFLDRSRLELKKTSFVYAARRHCSLPAAASGLRTSTFLFLRTEPSFLQTLILLYTSQQHIFIAEYQSNAWRQ